MMNASINRRQRKTDGGGGGGGGGGGSGDDGGGWDGLALFFDQKQCVAAKI
jgi:hypothetical protein